MAAIVQATCPGCKNILRIPADWVNQPIRCKHCGLVMLSKNAQAAAVGAPKPDAPKNTPLRVNRPPAETVPTVPMTKPTTPPVNKLKPRPPVAEAVVAAEPVALPTAVAPAPGNDPPFAEIDWAEANSGPIDKAPRSARKRRGAWWKGLVVVLAVLLLAGVILGVAWPQLSKLLPAPILSSLVKDNTLRDKEEGPPREGNK